MPYPLYLTVAAGALCLLFERLTYARLAAVAKVLASMGFVIAAIASPLSSSSYGHRIITGAAAGALGDAALVGKKLPNLIVGIALFLLGHVYYMQAMLLWGFNRLELGCYFIMMLAVTSVVKAWLWPSVSTLLRPFVLLYMVAFALLIACTIACATNHPRPIFALFGVACFFISDLFVAQERFKQKTRLQTYLGLPLYWLGQWCIVTTMGLS